VFPANFQRPDGIRSAAATGRFGHGVAPDDSAALPPNVDPSSPLAQVIKLTQAGVSEAVIMAYVTNSGSMFNLDPDKIIYLKDIGAPDAVVQAMIQRDQVLQAQMAAPAPAPVVAECRCRPATGGGDGGLFPRLARAVWRLGGRGGLWPLLATDGDGGQRGLAAVLRPRAMGLYGRRLVLDVGLFVGLGAVPLRTLVPS